MCCVMKLFLEALLQLFRTCRSFPYASRLSPYAHRFPGAQQVSRLPSYSSSWLPEPSPSPIATHRVREYPPVVHRLRLSALAQVPTIPERTSLPLETLGHRCVGFSPTCRYSRRHSLFHALHMPFRSCFSAACNAPLPHSCP